MKKVQKKRKIGIIVLVLTLALMGTGLGAYGIWAANTVTLYTGGGVVRANGWAQTSTGVYKATTDVTKLPTKADMTDACTTFVGWYTNPSYTGDPVTVPTEGGSYYAKYTRTNLTQAGSTMAYNYTNYTLNGYQLSGSSNVKTSFANYGSRVYYNANSTNPSGGGTYINVAISGDPYVQVSGTNLYVASVASFYGQYVKYTFYIWNKGTSNYYHFNLGTATDVQIANNDYATIQNTSDSNGRYISMQDSGKELRMYYSGSLVTNVSTLWIGRYSNSYRNHVFDNARSNVSGVDSAYDYSWKNITIPANGVVKKEVLLGCGNIGNMTIKFNYQVDTNGNGIIDSGDTVRTTVNEGTSVTLPACTGTKAGYVFAGYNTEADGSGYSYAAGASLKIQEDTYLYAQWEPIKNTLNVNLKRDDSTWSNQTVSLYKSGTEKYVLSKSGDVYTSNQVLNGTYDVYVNGMDSRKDITFDGAVAATTSLEVNYDTYTVTTTLDGSTSADPGYVSLYLKSDSSLYLGSENKSGVTTFYIPRDDVEYKLVIADLDTGFELSKSNKSVSVPYYTAKADVTYDSKWTGASVELKQNGTTAYTLAPGSGNLSNTVPYSKILQGDHEDATLDMYDLYVNSEKLGTITLTASGLTNGKTSLAATFYKATVTVKVDGTNHGNYTLTMKQNGKTAYQFAETVGKTGEYTVNYVLKRETDSYDLYLDGKDVEIDISKSNASPTVNYYTVSFMSFNSDSAEVYSTQTVLSGKTPSNISGPYVDGKTFLYWTKDIAGNTQFNFTGESGTKDTITASTKLYPQFATPQVSINSYGLCSLTGASEASQSCSGYNTSGTGYYYMPSFSITGFPATTKAIKYITFDITNGYIYLRSDASVGVTVDYYANDAANTATLKVSFTSKLTAGEAEEYVRTHVFFKSKNTSDGTIQAHVNGTTVQ